MVPSLPILLKLFLILSGVDTVLGLDPAVFSKEADLVPGSIGISPSLDCWDLLPLLLGTECAWPSVTDRAIEVSLCMISPDSGALVITSAAPFAGQVCLCAACTGNNRSL